SRTWFVSQMNSYLAGRAVDASGVAVSVQIAEHASDRFVLSLVVQTSAGVGQRTLEAASCAEVADAAAIIAASSVTSAISSATVEPEPPASMSEASQDAAPKPPSGRIHAEPRRARLQARRAPPVAREGTSTERVRPLAGSRDETTWRLVAATGVLWRVL